MRQWASGYTLPEMWLSHTHVRSTLTMISVELDMPQRKILTIVAVVPEPK